MSRSPRLPFALAPAPALALSLALVAALIVVGCGTQPSAPSPRLNSRGEKPTGYERVREGTQTFTATFWAYGPSRDDYPGGFTDTGAVTTPELVARRAYAWVLVDRIGIEILARASVKDLRKGDRVELVKYRDADWELTRVVQRWRKQ